MSEEMRKITLKLYFIGFGETICNIERVRARDQFH